MDHFDVAVIGAGPGGYVAAIRCAQLGLKTVCIDSLCDDKEKPVLGGTCLNVGCIPSKALLDSSERYHNVQKHLDTHGIAVDGVTLDLKKMMGRKDKLIKTLTGGIQLLFRKNEVTWMAGHARLLGEGKLDVTLMPKQEETVPVTATHIIIASGSKPIDLPSMPLNHHTIVDSTGALSFDEVPESLGIIGAGVIGLELGSVWRRLGSDVVVLEATETLLPMVDKDIVRQAEGQFRKQGLDVLLGTKVTAASSDGKQVTVRYTSAGGEEKSLLLDKLVVAVGRRPNTEGLNADGVGLKLDERGFVVVDEFCKTNLPNVYAIGDVVGGAMLAHKASEEGVAVAERLVGKSAHLNYQTIPSVIYTWPEIAWVGETEQALKASGREVKTGSFPFAASGRARAMEEFSGQVKMISDAKTDEILGVHMMGPNVSELVGEVVLAMEYKASSEDIACTIHAHPTLSEALHEAALAVDNRAIHV